MTDKARKRESALASLERSDKAFRQTLEERRGQFSESFYREQLEGQDRFIRQKRAEIDRKYPRAETRP